MLANAKTSEKSMLTIYEGKLAGADVAVLYSSVCKVNAAIAAQVLIGEYGCEAIINAGTAGAMDEALAVFDTVVGKHIKTVREDEESKRKEQKEHDQLRRCGGTNR